LSGFEVGIVLLSALLHASWNAATKGSESPTAFLLAMEILTGLLLLPVFFAFDFGQVPPLVWGLLVGSGVTHALYAYWLTRGYAHGELSLVYPIARSTPAFVPLAAIPLLGEQISFEGAAGIALVVCGMWAVQTDGRLRARDLASLGAAFAYLTLLTTVAYSLIDKQVMGALAAGPWRGPAPRSLAYMALLYYVYLPLFALLGLRRVGWRPVRAALSRRTPAIAGASLCDVASYALILKAFETAPVSYVVAVRQSSVLFAVGLGVLFLRERPGSVRLLGAGAIVVGVAAIALYP
jgi:drug/metabolite transporter (DMT)-like permease